MTSVADCPVCRQRVGPHCKSPTCDWFRCPRCGTWGNDKRHREAKQ